MTLTITATPGDANANSFATELEAIALAATRLNLTGWVTVTGSACTEDEKKALIEATRYLSTLTYQGYRTTAAQALAWPRECTIDPDAGATYYVLFDNNVIPGRVRDATIELAIAFLAAGTTDIAAVDAGLAVVRKTVDVISTEWAAPSQRPQGLARFPRVLRLISPLLQSAPGQVRLTR